MTDLTTDSNLFAGFPDIQPGLRNTPRMERDCDEKVFTVSPEHLERYQVQRSYYTLQAKVYLNVEEPPKGDTNPVQDLENIAITSGFPKGTSHEPEKMDVDPSSRTYIPIEATLVHVFGTGQDVKYNITVPSLVLAALTLLRGLRSPLWKALLVLLLFSLFPMASAMDPGIPPSSHTFRTALANSWATFVGATLGAFAFLGSSTQQTFRRIPIPWPRENNEQRTEVNSGSVHTRLCPYGLCIQDSLLSGFLMGSLACAWALIYSNPKTTYWLLWAVFLTWGYFTTAFGSVEFKRHELGRFSLLGALLLTMMLLALNPTLPKDGVVGASTWFPFSLSFSIFVMANLPIMVKHVQDLCVQSRRNFSQALRIQTPNASEDADDDVEAGQSRETSATST